MIHHESMTLPPVGEGWPLPSRIWGDVSGTGEVAESNSPLNGKLVQSVRLLSHYELEQLFGAVQEAPSFSTEELSGFLARLHANFLDMECDFFLAMRLETGFSFYDCREMIAGVESLLSAPLPNVHENERSTADIQYPAIGKMRRIQLVTAPWGTVAVILPQNAFLIIAVTALINGLATGNRVILRAPVQSARSASLLSHLLTISECPWSSVSVVLCKSLDFVDYAYRAKPSILLHYMGSSRHAASIIHRSFDQGTPLIVDGEGNVWVYVSEGCNVQSAAKILAKGSLRYYGQTCTSINGAMIHPSIYGSVRSALKQQFASARVGPLLDEQQATWCWQRIQESGGQVLVGGCWSSSQMAPTLVDSPSLKSDLVCEGLFGPALWIRQADGDEFVSSWPLNRFPLCAGILGPESAGRYWPASLAHVARVVLDGDPSIESVFEPWGGYPPSGQNPVGPWYAKYQRTIQIDRPDN